MIFALTSAVNNPTAPLIGGALFVAGIERFLPTAIAEPAEIGVVEPTPLQ